tara:strand:- start:23918 stop:24322 length:405 start_codon:yes stop_codon:yes gene_type:complete
MSIEQNAYSRNSVRFNFKFSKTEKYFTKHPDEIFTEGEDLTEFKNKTKLRDDELIKKALVKALNENLLKKTVTNGEFNNLEFTEKGMMNAKAILLNRKESKKKIFTYPLEKFIVPLITASLIAFATSYITNKIQ